jgi:ABC-type multidrug transport system permease subunit
LLAGGLRPDMALDAATAAVIGGVALFFFLMFLFVRRIITSFTRGYKEGR